MKRNAFSGFFDVLSEVASTTFRDDYPDSAWG